MSKKRKIIILVIIGLIIVTTLAYYIWLLKKPKPITRFEQERQAVLNKQWQFPIMKDIAMALKKYNNVELSTIDTDYMLWQKDDYMVSLSLAESIYITYKETAKGLSSGMPKAINNGDTLRMYQQTPLGSVSKIISKVFGEQGYILNALNSTKPGDFDYIQSYEKDGVLCSATLSGQLSWSKFDNFYSNDMEMNILCATGMEKSWAEQRPYFEALKLNGENAAIADIKKKDNFVRVSVVPLGYVGAAAYILKYDKGKYIVIDGQLQEEPQCKKMKLWNVPPEIYGSCYDAVVP